MLDTLLYEKLCHFCAYSERCRDDVQRKCYALKIPKEEVEAYLVKLEEAGFLNEQRYIKSFIEVHLVKKKWGAKKIQAALGAKRIKSSDYAHLLTEIDQVGYYATALALAEKKTSTIRSKSPQDHRAKLTRYLMSKGYENALISRVLKQLASVE